MFKTKEICLIITTASLIHLISLTGKLACIFHVYEWCICSNVEESRLFHRFWIRLTAVLTGETVRLNTGSWGNWTCQIFVCVCVCDGFPESGSRNSIGGGSGICVLRHLKINGKNEIDERRSLFKVLKKILFYDLRRGQMLSIFHQ